MAVLLSVREDGESDVEAGPSGGISHHKWVSGGALV